MYIYIYAVMDVV